MQFNYDVAPTEEQVKSYKVLRPMLESALTEMREFAKKKQDGIVSETKVKIVNRLLKQLREVLTLEASLEYLDLLDEETFPQNSDSVIILGQYLAALNTFRSNHLKTINYESTSVTKEWIETKEESEEDDDDDEYEDAEEEEIDS
jgi:hypothetical protein